MAMGCHHANLGERIHARQVSNPLRCRRKGDWVDRSWLSPRSSPVNRETEIHLERRFCFDCLWWHPSMARCTGA